MTMITDVVLSEILCENRSNMDLNIFKLGEIRDMNEIRQKYRNFQLYESFKKRWKTSLKDPNTTIMKILNNKQYFEL